MDRIGVEWFWLGLKGSWEWRWILVISLLERVWLEEIYGEEEVRLV